MVFDTYEFTSRGGRSYNEDSAGSRTDGEHGIFVVADGLGGHSFGELASAAVRDALLEGFPCRDGDPAQWLEAQIAEANQRVLQLQQEKNAVMKSTAAALYVMGSRAIWAHAGDSRLYYIHEGRITACTEDHSVASPSLLSLYLGPDIAGSDAGSGWGAPLVIYAKVTHWLWLSSQVLCLA